MLVEHGAGRGVLGPRRDRSTLPRLRIPEALNVAAGQGHRGIEADDRELAGDVEDGLDDGLAYLRLEVVELSRVVPGHARAVVAVVDEADAAGPVVGPLEDDSGVGRVPVVIFDLDGDPLIIREVAAGKRVGGVRGVGQLEEPVGMLDHPA